jgi:DNA-binding LacI/PurR family transcriptional regulator
MAEFFRQCTQCTNNGDFFGMDKQRITEISQKSGRSPSTVSKVLRNCPGVDPETREEIRCAVGQRSVEGLRLKGSGDKDICVILPDHPKFFWNRVLSALKEEDFPISTKVYSSVHRDREVSRCLGEAIDEGASAVVFGGCPGEALREELARLAKEMLILQLCEYTPIPNTFFVGSDFYGDGRALAKAVRAEGGRRPIVGLVSGGESVSDSERLRGFLDGLDGRAEIVRIPQPEVSSLYASHLARAIDGTGACLDYLFCCSGMTVADCDALYKLKGKMATKYIGFEFPQNAQKHWENGQIAALAVQEPKEEIRLALSFARRYVETRQFPDQKMTRLPSSFHFWEK